MPSELPGPCALCGATAGVRRGGDPHCAVCGWRYGDAPDPELPLPRVEVVYYLAYADRVKIGTSATPRRRLTTIRHDELLAFERGGRAVERRRHTEFADVREGGEWFTRTAALEQHIAALRAVGDPWSLYARWFAEALAGEDGAAGFADP